MDPETFINAITAIPRLMKEVAVFMIWGEQEAPCICKGECQCKKKKRWRMKLQ